MARYKGTIAVSQVIGKVGEVNFKRWKAGILVVQPVSTSIRNPNSAAQMVQREVFSVYSKLWMSLLTPAQRADWETYALTAPGFYVTGQGVRQIIGTNGGTMSGMNCYCLTNAWLISAGLAAVTDPPLAAPAPTVIGDLSATSVLGVHTVIWTAPEAEALAITRIWIASASGKFHKQIVAAIVAVTATAIIVDIQAALGKVVNLATFAGGVVYLQADTVNPTGGKSAGSNTFELVLTALP